MILLLYVNNMRLYIYGYEQKNKKNRNCYKFHVKTKQTKKTQSLTKLTC